MPAHGMSRWFTTPILLTTVFLVGCDRAGDRPAPTAVRPIAGPRADLAVPSGSVPDWVLQALNLGAILSDNPSSIAWTDEDESDEASDAITIVPFDFDPFHTSLVRARWLRGIGCPTNATTNDGTNSGTFMDGACPTGGKDMRNEGLLLAKTGPTSNFASAGAEVKGVKGISLSELGYDIRTGSHCGAGAPRFNVVTSDGALHFVGCVSPPPVVMAASTGWKRLRWDPATAFPPILASDVVASIAIVFDEGQDAMGAPDFSGLAVIDNIDINGTLVGRGPGN
jgi:hypothetical protein